MIEKVQEHKEGSPWKIVRRFSSFDEANEKRNELLEDPGLQVKVRFMPGCYPKNDNYYAVKVRVDPAVEAERLLQEARDLKKRKKKNLQKKRRKK